MACSVTFFCKVTEFLKDQYGDKVADELTNHLIEKIGDVEELYKSMKDLEG